MRAADAAVEALNVARNQSLLLWLTLAVTGAALLAAFRAANAAHKTLEGLERPFLQPSPTVASRTVLESGGETVRLAYSIGNFGRAPAIIDEIAFGARRAGEIVAAAALARYTNDVRKLSIFVANVPGASHDSAPTFVDVVGSTHAARSSGLFIFGRIRYFSVTGARYERTFCWQFMGVDSLKTTGGSSFNTDRRLGQFWDRIKGPLGWWFVYLPDWLQIEVLKVAGALDEEARERDNKVKL